MFSDAGMCNERIHPMNSNKPRATCVQIGQSLEILHTIMVIIEFHHFSNADTNKNVSLNETNAVLPFHF